MKYFLRWNSVFSFGFKSSVAQVMKLLEKESIKWDEGGNAGMILIRLDKINWKGLSFATR